MRLFLYYGLHSFFNQLKKLFKSWVLIFILVCALIGGGIGAGIAALEDATEAKEESAVTEEEEAEDASLEEEEPLAEIIGDEELTEGFSALSSRIHVTDVVEAAAGLIVLAVLVYEILSADRNGSKIFLPADVPLLFASPMKPQSVLMFRLMTQMGMAIMASIYLLFQLPNLTLNLGLSLWASLTVIFSWILTILVGKLIQVLLYTVCSTHLSYKPLIRRITYVCLILLAVGLIGYIQLGGYMKDGLIGVLDGTVRFLNAPLARFIPFWGWIKGFLRMAMEENTVMCLVFLGLLVAGMGVLIYIIWHVKADFYEDAMAKSEETAELLAKAQSAQGGLVVTRRKKDRSEKLLRDGMQKGRGANVFFHKAIYNRRRFSHFGFLTKTAETYLVAAVAVALFTRFAGESDTLIPVALTLAGLSFFRSLGNPISQDTQMSYFLLIPEKTGWKLFYSLMGGSLNCLLDVLNAMVPAVVILGADPGMALLWMVVIVTVDLYASIVGTFIDLSVPAHAGKTVKQVIQIMFIYFGLIPDIIVVVLSLVLIESPLLAALGTALINIGFGGVFFFLSAMAIDHCFGK